jgi:TonB family protein
MKKIIFLILVVIMIGCNQKKEGIEIIENIDDTYLTEDKVDQTAEPISDKDGLMFNAEVEKIITEINKNSKRLSYPIGLRIYINKDGEIDKIMPLDHYMIQNLMKKNVQKENIIEINNYPKLITEKLLPFFTTFKFYPAMLNGKPVPYRTDIKTLAVFDSLGKFKLELDWNLSMNLNLDKKFVNKDDYYVTVEEMPSPIGGMRAIQEGIHYPEIAKRAGVQGRVYVKAFIDENGNVAQAEIIKGLEGGGLNEAALEAIKATKFKPGIQNGKPVKVQVSIPIMFKLQ